MYVPMTTVTVGGRDITRDFGLVYTTESGREPPEIVTRYVDVPGMDGVVDATDSLTGEPQFANRLDTMVFYVDTDRDVRKTETELANFLSGRRFEYSYSFDPGYTYSGRFRVTAYPGWYDRRIQVEVDSDPWKRGTHHLVKAMCGGGRDIVLHNGRRPVSPAITCPGPCVVDYRGQAWEIPEGGTWQIYDWKLVEGTSTVRINSAPTYGDATLQDLEDQYGTLGNVPTGTRLEQMFIKRGQAPTGPQYEVTIEYYEYAL